jgi:hypothetical protein
LAARTVPIATGVRHEVFLPAMGTLILMTTQRRGVTGGDGAKNLPVMTGQTTSLGKLRQYYSDDFAQSDGLCLPGRRATGHTASGFWIIQFGGRGRNRSDPSHWRRGPSVLDEHGGRSSWSKAGYDQAIAEG